MPSVRKDFVLLGIGRGAFVLKTFWLTQNRQNCVQLGKILVKSEWEKLLQFGKKFGFRRICTIRLVRNILDDSE